MMRSDVIARGSHPVRCSFSLFVLHASCTSCLPGDERPGVIPADIVFTIDEKPHAIFRRDGNDLIYTVRLSLTDALCGCQVNIQHLDGSVLPLNIIDVITPSSAKIIRSAKLMC